MKETIEKAFTSHILRYIGVGLISGSIVHIGTLGGGVTQYAALITLGIIAFIVGTILEKSEEVVTVDLVIISVLLSIGVGMVSGATQHYLDGPVYASFLLPLGLFLGYCMFVLREDRKALRLQKVAIAAISALLLFGLLYGAAHSLPALNDHHSETEKRH